MRVFYSKYWRCYTAQHTKDGTLFTGHGETQDEAIYRCLSSMGEYSVFPTGYCPEVNGL